MPSGCTDGHGATPGDADGISPRGCGCGRRNGAPGHPRPHGGETHGQGAPGSRIIAQAATNEPRMDWAPILQEKGHGAHPGTHRGHGVQPSSQPSKPAKLNHGSTARFWVFLPSIPQFTRLGIRQVHHNLKRPSQSPQSNAPRAHPFILSQTLKRRSRIPL